MIELTYLDGGKLYTRREAIFLIDQEINSNKTRVFITGMEEFIYVQESIEQIIDWI